jgi:hypothetical protein
VNVLNLFFDFNTGVTVAMRTFFHIRKFRNFATALPVAAFCLAASMSAAEAKRLALVVGNSEYDQVYSLKNAAKDAKDVSKALEGLDFEVTLLTDTDEDVFWQKLEEFALKAEADDVESTLFYFSGHAFQLDGANYLVPSDAVLSSREAIENDTWRLDKIVKRLEDRNRQTLIFLDACRNNPLPESQRGDAQGLAKLQTGSGTFVAFATQPNNVTADGAGDNSPFTQAILQNVAAEGISISDMMIRVRNSVEEATFSRQTPWDQSSLRAQFYFKPVVERTASLSEADYEMIAALDPETRNLLLAALGNAGLVVEDAEVEQQIEARVAAANPAFLIEDVPDVAGEPVEAEADPSPEVVASASTTLPTPAPRPLTADVAEPEVAAPENFAAFTLLDVDIDAPGDVDVASVTPADPVAEGLVPTASADVSVAGLLPSDPLLGREIKPGDELEALVLASLSPTRSLVPIFLPRSRVEGRELSRDEAESVGIELPDETELTGRPLARQVQIELSRLGCYRSGVDGLWGKGSALALVRYYGNKRVAANNLNPSNSLLQILRTEPQVICEGVVIKNQRVAKATAIIKKKNAPAAETAAKTSRLKQTRTTTVTTKSGEKKEKTITRLSTGVFR